MSGIVEPPVDLGTTLMGLIERMFPICRSITGDGVRRTLEIVSELIPLEIHEVSSGTKVLDWIVPPEWNIRDAYIKNDAGERVVDFQRSNLHVVGYSVPVHERMTLDVLRPHLHTLENQPDLVPYRTSYYSESWGFCISQNQLDELPDGNYEVMIDSTLAPGSLTYGEHVIPGRRPDEVLISTHICHPSLCDDNLSGVAIATTLAAALADRTPDVTIRFLFAPGTIGAITWLERNRNRLDRIIAGLTLTCLGDDHPFTFKRTERGNTLIDRVANYVFDRSPIPSGLIDFFPYGYDERQYNSPGFRVPVGSLMRGRHGQFPEYHTSADDLTFVKPSCLEESFSVLNEIVGIINRNRVLVNTEPYGEPQLGSRGLYDALGGTNIADAQLAMLWILNQSDGLNDLLDIAVRSRIDFHLLADTASVLEQRGLVVESGP